MSDATNTPTDEELQELRDKPLDDLTGPELHTYAAHVLGLDVPEKVTDKAALRYIVDLALRSPAEASGAQQAPVATNETTEDIGDGYERAFRPVTEVVANGDWRNPFTGLLVYHGQDADPSIVKRTEDDPGIGPFRVQREGDGRKYRRDQAGHPFLPVKTGDQVYVDRLVIEGED